MSPQTQAAATTTATAGKRKMLANALAVKSTNPVSKKTRKQKKHRPLAEQDQINAAAAAGEPAGGGVLLSAALPPARQLEFLLRSFERAAKMRLSPLELGTYSEGCVVQLTQGASQDVESFGDHVKRTFGASWKEDLCEGNLIEGLVEAGSPALLVISLGALRSLELLRGLKMFTRGCRAVKLFAKHMKVEEQGLGILEPRTARLVTSVRVRLNTLGCSSCFVAALLKARVNIACGTPSRIKKLIDMEALSLSRLKLVVFDMQRDPKSFNLFTLPQVSNEFWDLYKGYLDQKVKEGDTRICFYGAVSEKDANKVLPPAE